MNVNIIFYITDDKTKLDYSQKLSEKNLNNYNI